MDKKLFRKGCLDTLKKRSKRSCFALDKHLNKKLLHEIRQGNSKTIMLYIPISIEVNVMPLIRTLRRDGREVLVPFMEGESFRLVKYKMPLEKKQFGISEPKYSKHYRIKKIDLAIVPIVGTDPSLRRVGFGKGMYDRFFEREQKKIKKILFVTRVNCYTSTMVTDHHDIKAEQIISDKKSLFRKNSVRIK